MGRKSKSKSKSSNTTLILIVVLVVAAAGFIWANNQRPQTVAPENQNQNTGGSTNTSTSTTYQQTYQGANERAPQSVTALISPGVVQMGNLVYGTLSSDGYNYPVTIYAKLKGSGTINEIAGLLGPDGRYQIVQQITIPGFWEFWAIAGSVRSNTAQLTVQGLKVVGESETYSKTLRASMTLQVFCHINGNIGIILNDPAHSISYTLTNAVTSNGYTEISVSLNSYAYGDYEIDAIIGGIKASDYTYGSFWIKISR